MSHQLDQAKVWTNREGLQIPVDTMSGRYALNAYRLLERSATEVVCRYSLYLGTISMPSEGTVAFDAIEAEIGRQIDRMQHDPLGWLHDKPLMQALLGRVQADGVQYNAPASPPDDEPVTGYDLPPFERTGPARQIPADVRKPGDESIVFIASTGDCEDYGIKAVFVGNRQAAYQYAAEHDRYAIAPLEIDELDDSSIGDGVGREYPVPFTEITYHTEIDLDVIDVVSDWRPRLEIRQAGAQPPTTEKTAIRRHSREPDRLVIQTVGPEYQLDEVQALHRTTVTETLASLMGADKTLTEGDK